MSSCVGAEPRRGGARRSLFKTMTRRGRDGSAAKSSVLPEDLRSVPSFQVRRLSLLKLQSQGICFDL